MPQSHSAECLFVVCRLSLPCPKHIPAPAFCSSGFVHVCPSFDEIFRARLGVALGAVEAMQACELGLGLGRVGPHAAAGEGDDEAESELRTPSDVAQRAADQLKARRL